MVEDTLVDRDHVLVDVESALIAHDWIEDCMILVRVVQFFHFPRQRIGRKPYPRKKSPAYSST